MATSEASLCGSLARLVRSLSVTSDVDTAIQTIQRDAAAVVGADLARVALQPGATALASAPPGLVADLTGVNSVEAIPLVDGRGDQCGALTLGWRTRQDFSDDHRAIMGIVPTCAGRRSSASATANEVFGWPILRARWPRQAHRPRSPAWCATRDVTCWARSTRI